MEKTLKREKERERGKERKERLVGKAGGGSEGRERTTEAQLGESEY
jgi:hypothetical protein